MGDIKRLKKKYTPPAHPWIKSAIEEGSALIKEFGLVKKKEILIAASVLKKYKNMAKRLIADTTVQGQKEKEMLMSKVFRLGLLPQNAPLDDVLSLQVKDLLERRLQSVVFRKNLARSMKQARQFITHRHIIVGKKQITSPSYLLSREEEIAITVRPGSTLASETHPERIAIQKKEPKPRPVSEAHQNRRMKYPVRRVKHEASK
ncbi:30S ribosomal protein S4 [Candidatus Woesearchaeota archaeon]|nr:30S ribosomal protein S4 [Candidatus Woesearchaeota archaeon]